MADPRQYQDVKVSYEYIYETDDEILMAITVEGHEMGIAILDKESELL